MQKGNRKLLKIITEASIERLITDDIKKLGAKGYTKFEAHGEGSRGVREGDWEQNRNICFEIICREETAEKITSYMFETYYENYAMVITVHDVEILRPEKF